jgi:hypothetical protein
LDVWVREQVQPSDVQDPHPTPAEEEEDEEEKEEEEVKRRHNIL